MQAAAQQSFGLLAAGRGQHFYLDAHPLSELRNGHIVEERIFFFPQHHGGHAQRPAGQLALTLVDDIRGRDKTCHTHVAAEEFVLDGGAP